jgi:hypothetical protein
MAGQSDGSFLPDSLPARFATGNQGEWQSSSSPHPASPSNNGPAEVIVLATAGLFIKQCAGGDAHNHSHMVALGQLLRESTDWAARSYLVVALDRIPSTEPGWRQRGCAGICNSTRQLDTHRNLQLTERRQRHASAPELAIDLDFLSRIRVRFIALLNRKSGVHIKYPTRAFI